MNIDRLDINNKNFNNVLNIEHILISNIFLIFDMNFIFLNN